MNATGEPFQIGDRAASPSVSRDGTLLYVARSTQEQQLVWVDRSGSIRETVGAHEGSAVSPDVSPDGSRIAFVTAAEGRSQIWVFEPAKGVRMPLTREPAAQLEPVWSADGGSVFYVSTPPGSSNEDHREIRTARPGGASSVVVERGYGPSVSVDGRSLVFSVGNVGGGQRTLHYLALDDMAARPKAFSSPGVDIGNVRLSPDGRFIAFVQGDWTTGRSEVYLSAFPEQSGHVQVSSGGGTWIRWNAAGDRLYYVRTSDGALMEVEVQLTPSVRLGEPRVLFVESTAQANLDRGFAVSADGSRFLVVRERVPHGEQAGGLVLVQNWIDAFQR